MWQLLGSGLAQRAAGHTLHCAWIALIFYVAGGWIAEISIDPLHEISLAVHADIAILKAICDRDFWRLVDSFADGFMAAEGAGLVKGVGVLSIGIARFILTIGMFYLFAIIAVRAITLLLATLKQAGALLANGLAWLWRRIRSRGRGDDSRRGHGFTNPNDANERMGSP